MKLLVTGGAGFIGSHLLQLLVQDADIETVVLDNLSSGSYRHVPGSIRLVEGNICDKNIDELFVAEHFDAVIHLAAQTMVPYSLEHPDEDCNTNLMGIINILECCRKHGVKSVVFSSSAAIYGDNLNVPLKESERPLPTSFYGLTKMASEHYLRLYHDLYGINTTVLRFANVYGERQGEGGEGGAISIFCKLLAAGKPVTVFGNGEQTRDFVYAGDIAKALLKAVSLEGHHTINISTQEETSLNQLLEAFRKAVGHQFTINYAPARTGDIFRSVLCHDNCREYLGFVPSMGLTEGVQRTYADYVKNFEDRR